MPTQRYKFQLSMETHKDSIMIIGTISDILYHACVYILVTDG